MEASDLRESKAYINEHGRSIRLPEKFLALSDFIAIAAHEVVDATGDADVAARAGAPGVRGREEDGRMRPVSLFFRVGNINVKDGTIP